MLFSFAVRKELGALVRVKLIYNKKSSPPHSLDSPHPYTLFQLGNIQRYLLTVFPKKARIITDIVFASLLFRISMTKFSSLTITLFLPVLIAIALHVLSSSSSSPPPKPHYSCALVTGASTGIGREIALELAFRGFLVFAGVRKASDGRSIREEFASANPGVIGIVPILFDVTWDEERLTETQSEILRTCSNANRAFTILVNNAGVQQVAAIETANSPRDVFDVNVFGLLQVTKLFTPVIRRGVLILKERAKKRGENDNASPDFSGRIINIGSVAGFSTLPFYGLYSATKRAVEAINDALRLELNNDDIDVILIEPGAVLTSIEAKMDSQIEEQRALAAALPHANDYSLRLKKMSDTMRYMMESVSRKKIFFTSARETAKIVRGAIMAKAPKTRYLVGLDAKVFYVASLVVPDRVMDYILNTFC